MEKLFDILLSKYGLAGAIILALGWYIMYLHKINRADRRIERDDRIKLSDQMIENQKDATLAQRQTGEIMASLKSLLETTREKIR